MSLTSGQCIFEDLLESQELQNGQIDGGMEPKTTLIWAKSGIELNTVSTVNLGLEFVIFPDNAELDDPLRNCGNMQGFFVFGMFFEERGMFEGGGQL